MKQNTSALQIARALYGERQNQAFLNQKIIKIDQIERLIEKMMDKYNNFYRERSASRDKTQKENKENKNVRNVQKYDNDGF